MPDVYRRLLDDHTPAANGCGRCRACTVPGTGSPGAVWPCSMHQLAVLARKIHDRPLRGRAE
ncbi:MAG: hypothetical protein EPO40_03000 [Myxococcaceae bacterium]|nr:MAG: hypothetical protein EPO40_03000 [Myxococcaceae bacterium]